MDSQKNYKKVVAQRNNFEETLNDPDFIPRRMKKLLPLLLGATAVLAGNAIAQNATTTPVGAMTYTIAGSTYSAIGVPLLRPPVASGAIVSGNATTATLAGSVDLSTLLNANTSYFIEVVGHTDGSTATQVGDRFDLDVAATIAAGGNVLHINTASSNNTAVGNFSGLANYIVAVRPHWTLASLFGTGASAPLLQSSTTLPGSDQVHFWTGAGMSTYWFRQNSAGTLKEWRNAATGTSNQDNAIIPPGTGVFFKRTGATPFSFTVLGDVRINKFVQQISTGTRLIASGFPVAMSPTETAFLPGTGFISATTSVAADQIWAWTGTGVSTYWLRQNSAGTVKEWRNTSTGTSNQTDAKFLDPQSAFFVKTQANIDSIEVPKPF